MDIIRLHTVSSTNDIAKAEIKNRGNVCIVADNQTKGRGRNKNVWYGNPNENLYCSFAVTHKQPPSLKRLVIYQAIAALAIKDALQEFHVLNIFRIKYPNDILAFAPEGYKKIAGILIEHEFMGNKCLSTVTGIGINVLQTEFPDEIKNFATSMKLLKCKTTPDGFLSVLIEKYENYRKTRMEDIFNQWKTELDIEDKKASIINNSDIWTIRKVRRDFRLLLINDSTGEQRLIDDGDSIRYDIRRR